MTRPATSPLPPPTSRGCDRVEGWPGVPGWVAEIRAASSFPLLLCFTPPPDSPTACPGTPRSSEFAGPVTRRGGTWPWKRSPASLVGEFLTHGVPQGRGQRREVLRAGQGSLGGQVQWDWGVPGEMFPKSGHPL